jgi:hypothetical protein
MIRSKRERASGPDVQAGVYFQQMADGDALGDFIAAGRAQRQLERLGWLVRRTGLRDHVNGCESAGAAPPLAAEAVVGDLTDEEVEADSAEPAGHLLGTIDVCRLVGLTEPELDDAIEAGRFPLPDGYVSLQPYWERDAIGWWVKRGRAL